MNKFKLLAGVSALALMVAGCGDPDKTVVENETTVVVQPDGNNVVENEQDFNTAE
jgi:hypothetical protein